MDMLATLSENPLHPAAWASETPSPPSALPGAPAWISGPGGIAEIGHGGRGFAFDCEGPRHKVMVYPHALADRTVTTDELYAVGATFTLVAWGFAYVFDALQMAQPGCFIAAVDADQPRTWMELLFLSFTNLTSTGLSDVVPITPQARAVVMIEQIAGLGYVALFVSRLVGLTIALQMTPGDQKRSGNR